MKKSALCILACGLVSAAAFAGKKNDNGPKDFSGKDSETTVLGQVFGLRDENGIKAAKKAKLPIWQGLYDFDKQSPADQEFPWRRNDLNITKPAEAKIFAKIMQEYVYQGWFNAANKNKPEAQFRSNDYRTWCSTPWMVDGAKGREAVHGLTKEFPMEPNALYPAQPGVFEHGKKSELPSSWGVAYFNKPVCDIYQQMFGTPQAPLMPPNKDLHRTVSNPDGFVSFKLLFNTMQKWQEYKPFAGAYTWKAFVSPTQYDPERKLQEVPHIQMDISIKDSQLRGTRDDVDYWVMLTYVYDKDFDYAAEFGSQLGASTEALEHLPEVFQKMRPVGVQYGLEAGQSIIFDNAKTNYKRGDRVIPHGPDALLNGPADNPYSSCLGCHGAAGLEDGMAKELDEKKFQDRGGVWKFTLFSNDDFQSIKKKYDSGFEFNRQTKKAIDAYLGWQEKVVKEKKKK